MSDEPRKHPLFMLALALTSLATVPFLFIGPEPAFLLGLPAWLWWSGAWTVLLSCLTAWGILRYWKDDGDG